ncbi:type IV toxin-antitoxin system AbiEi family antitoxin [Rouxiella sp. T17]|uniref:type IV toxin-antitoxin system AbiEi family antitoxin n=1 Tax=Rouxiella sp. T17 TaxID=3085684 RepID=UPI002FC9AF19
MVSKAFEYLKGQREYRDSKNGRQLTDREKLMSIWLQNYATTLRAKLKSIRLEVPVDWAQLQLRPDEIWGGEAAANLLIEGYPIPEELQLLIHTSLNERAKELSVKVNSQGKLWITRAFWGVALKLNHTGEAMLCIAGLIASGDDRNIETARMINDKYLNLKEGSISRY